MSKAHYGVIFALSGDTPRVIGNYYPTGFPGPAEERYSVPLDERKHMEIIKRIARSGGTMAERENAAFMAFNPNKDEGPKFIVRVGDQDDYHVEDTLAGVAKRLNHHGVTRLLRRNTRFGVDAPGYRRNNYISLFYGISDADGGSTPIRGITQSEFDEINDLLMGA